MFMKTMVLLFCFLLMSLGFFFIVCLFFDVFGFNTRVMLDHRMSWDVFLAFFLQEFM